MPRKGWDDGAPWEVAGVLLHRASCRGLASVLALAEVPGGPSELAGRFLSEAPRFSHSLV